jgi:hypothetical protein
MLRKATQAPERPDFKIKLYAEMEQVAPVDILFASSSSGITPSVIQSQCKHPERVLIGHPFNPPHIIPLVEVVGGSKTSPDAVQQAISFYASIGKKPSAGLGTLLTLMLFGMPLDIIGVVGIILLIGIVKKNGIMLVDFALASERERGLKSDDAIREACRLRFRPILMTTLCALLAGVPLMVGTGTGSEIRQPLGYAIVGGLLVSQLLTLFTTPVVYIYMDRLSSWLNRRRTTEVGGAAAHRP